MIEEMMARIKRSTKVGDVLTQVGLGKMLGMPIKEVLASKDDDAELNRAIVLMLREGTLDIRGGNLVRSSPRRIG